MRKPCTLHVQACLPSSEYATYKTFEADSGIGWEVRVLKTLNKLKALFLDAAFSLLLYYSQA
jgi:hypothetical protein